jgi:Tfp pilus assembly protein PilN
MTQVNLLPTDIKVRQQTRRTMALVVAAGMAVFGLLFFVYVLQSARLVREQHKLTAQEQVNSGLQAQFSSLAQFQDLKNTLAARRALVTEVESGEVQWSGVLRDVSMVIPDNMYLTSLTGSVNPTAAAAGAAPTVTSGVGLVGSMQFQGVAGDYPTVSKWLTRVEEVTGWVNPWANSATKDSASSDGRVNFTGSLDLSLEATVHGGVQ